MSLWRAILLGIVQGLTEFLPVSSTAHLRVIPALLGWEDPGAAFTAVIQLGTLAAVLVFFARELWAMARGFGAGLVSRRPMQNPDGRLAIYVIVGTVPIGVAGLALRKWIEHEARSLYVVSASLVALAVLLFVAERVARHVKAMGQLGFAESQFVGLAQALALIPGVSRSGVTITAGLFCGLTRDAAARFSFLLSVPAVAAAGLFELRHLTTGSAMPGMAAVIAGTVAAFVSGYLAIGGLIRYLRTRSTLVFVVYRIALGALVAGLAAAGVAR